MDLQDIIAMSLPADMAIVILLPNCAQTPEEEQAEKDDPYGFRRAEFISSSSGGMSDAGDAILPGTLTP